MSASDAADAPAQSPAAPSAMESRDYGKLIMLGVLHMAQYFPAAFTGVALPFIFRREGLPLEMFWLLALPGIPRWFKWLIALVVDNHGSERIGYRKSWIIPCTAIGALAYAVLALFPPSLSAVYLIVAILVFKSLVMAAQDIAVDAYAAESMNARERPVGTSIINFLAVLAGVLGTGAVALVETFGWPTTMLAASALLVVAALPAILRREPPPPEATRRRRARGERASLMSALRRRESRLILPFLFAFGFGGAFAASMIGPFFADRGLTLTEFGILSPIAAIAGSALGAIATPWLIGHLGLRSTAVIGIAVLPVEGAMFGAFAFMPSLPALPVLIVMVATLGFMTSIYGFCASISRFRWVSKAQAGTDYSMQSSIWNLGIWVAGSVSGLVAANVGWTTFFPIAGLVAAGGGALYLAMFDRVEDLVQARESREAASNSQFSAADDPRAPHRE